MSSFASASAGDLDGTTKPQDGSTPNVEHASQNQQSTLPSSEPSSTNQEPESTVTSKKRKLTSRMWDHFDKVTRDKQEYAICKYCEVTLKAPSRDGTKTLHNHHGRCPGKQNQTIQQSLDKQKKIVIDRKGDGKVQYVNQSFDQAYSRRELVVAVITHEYPLSIVEHVKFMSFITSLQPYFKTPCRNTIKKDITKIYDCEAEKLYKVLENLKGRIAITMDMWTSNQKKGYMAITCHFIDDSWILHSHIMRFVYVPSPHTKDELARHLLEAFTKWNIETKISSITVDNCTTNDGMVSIIAEKLYGDLLLDGKLLHMRCCAHILNLVVKDGMSILDSAIVRIRESVFLDFHSKS